MYQPHYDAKNCAMFFVEGPLPGEDVFAGAINVFVCGALQNPAKMTPLIGRSPAFAPAVAIGFERTVMTIGGKRVPFMVRSADPATVLTGVVWLDLSESDLAAIESLELDGGLRERIAIDVKAGERVLKAFTYIAGPGVGK